MMASRFPSSQAAQNSVNKSSLSHEDADQTTLPEHQVIPGSQPTDNVHPLEMTRFSEKQQSLMKDILQMKNEIASLENQLESVQQMCPDGITMEQLDRTLSDRQCAEIENSEELVPLIKDLALQESLTGILLEDIVVKKMDHGDDACVEKMCRLTGSCGDIAFQLDFNIEERQNTEDQSSKARITSLKIKTEDPSDNLRELLASFEKDLSIQGFFKMMVPYTEWKSHRRTALEHFDKKYPEMISLPDGVHGTKLQIKSTAFQNSTWIITWDILLLETYEVDQSLQLSVKAKKSVLRMDRDNLLASIPEIFQKMLETLGIEGAIEGVIKFACKS